MNERIAFDMELETMKLETALSSDPTSFSKSTHPACSSAFHSRLSGASVAGRVASEFKSYLGKPMTPNTLPCQRTLFPILHRLQRTTFSDP
jgi:hypothetical protein